MTFLHWGWPWPPTPRWRRCCECLPGFAGFAKPQHCSRSWLFCSLQNNQIRDVSVLSAALAANTSLTILEWGVDFVSIVVFSALLTSLVFSSVLKATRSATCQRWALLWPQTAHWRCWSEDPFVFRWFSSSTLLTWTFVFQPFSKPNQRRGRTGNGTGCEHSADRTQVSVV